MPKFPAAARDLALICDKGMPIARLSDIIKTAAGSVLESVKLFDIYEGLQVPKGKKSVAFSLTMRSADKTLTDEEADCAVRRALNELEKSGVSLRI